jgi:hypothetical protein
LEDSDNDSLVSAKKIKPALQILGKLSNDFHRIKLTQHGQYTATSPVAGQSEDFQGGDQNDCDNFSDIDSSVRKYQSAVRTDHKMKAQIRNQIIHWGKQRNQSQ